MINNLRKLKQKPRGFSLLEILVGISIGVLSMMAIYQIFSTWEGRRRTVTGGAEAQMAAATGIFDLERDLKVAGFGFGHIDLVNLEKSVQVAKNGIAPFSTPIVPVLITNGAGAGASDEIRIFYGSSDYMTVGRKYENLTASVRAEDTLTGTRGGIQQGDIVLAVDDDASLTTPANLFEVTDTSNIDGLTVGYGTQGYDSFYVSGIDATMPTYSNSVSASRPPTGFLYNLGPNPKINEWKVEEGILRYRNLLDAAAQVSDVVEGVVNMQAQYGLVPSTAATDPGIVTQWLDADLLGSGDMARVRAVRVGILVRSQQFEKNEVTPDAPSWAGGVFKMKDLDAGAGDVAKWSHYRYRVYETLVPIRNLIWGVY